MQSFSGRLDMAVLICSSSHRFRQSLETILGAMGCASTASVGDASEAVQQASAQQFDIAIIDDAFDALEMISLPAIRMVSSPIADPTENELSKPFRPADLAHRLAESLARHSANPIAAAQAATS